MRGEVLDRAAYGDVHGFHTVDASRRPDRREGPMRASAGGPIPLQASGASASASGPRIAGSCGVGSTMIARSAPTSDKAAAVAAALATSPSRPTRTWLDR